MAAALRLGCSPADGVADRWQWVWTPEIPARTISTSQSTGAPAASAARPDATAAAGTTSASTRAGSAVA